MASVATDGGAAPDATAYGRYTRVAIWLHWTIAALIVANLAIGLFHDDFPDALRGSSMGFHKTAGIIVLLLSIARLGWRIAHPPPPQDREHKAWERLLAKTTHRAFYVLMIAVPLAGWIFVSAAATPRPLEFFGLFPIPFLPVPRTEGVNAFWHEAHEIMAFGIIGLLALHVAGALKHQLLDRDRELARMGIGEPG